MKWSQSLLCHGWLQPQIQMQTDVREQERSQHHWVKLRYRYDDKGTAGYVVVGGLLFIEVGLGYGWVLTVMLWSLR